MKNAILRFQEPRFLCLPLLCMLLQPSASHGQQPLNCASTYGADPTGTADSTSSIQSCFAALVSGQLAYLPKGIYKISSTLTLGGGSDSGASTKNNVGLIGDGAYGVTTGGLQTGTNLKWIGGSSVPMMEVAGPIQSVWLDRVGFDCGNDGNSANSASVGLKITHSSYARYSRLNFVNCKSWGFTVMARYAAVPGVSYNAQGNIFEQMNITNFTSTAAGGFQVGLPATVLPLTGTERINVGGSQLTDESGFLWSTDSGAGFSGGTPYSFGSSIPNASPETQSLYQTLRYGAGPSSFSYSKSSLPVASYRVNLKFADPYHPTGRRFNVVVNGSAWLSDYEIAADAGGYSRAIDKTTVVTVQSSGTYANKIQIDFNSIGVGDPMVNGIEIIRLPDPPSADMGASRNTFNNIEVGCWASGNAGRGVSVRYADANHYRDVLVVGCAKSIHFEGPSDSPDFPVNETFDKPLLYVTPSWSPIWAPKVATKIRFIGFTRDYSTGDPSLKTSYTPAFPSRVNFWGTDIQGFRYNYQ